MAKSVEDSRTKNTARNLAWGFVNRVVSVLLPFLVRTVLIYTLGVEYVGLGSLFTSLLGVLSLAELGFSSALVFSMYRPIAEKNHEKVCALLSYYKKCYRVIGIVILLGGLALLPVLPYLVDGDLPGGVDLRALYLIYLANTVVGYFLFAYKQSVFVASQRRDYISNVGTVLAIVSAALQIAALVSFRSYYLFSFVLLFITCLNNFAIAYLFSKRFPNVECKGILSKRDLAEIKTNVLGLVTQKIGTVALTSVGSVVVSAFLGLTTLGIYNNYFYIVTALVSFMGIVQSGIVPSVGNSIALLDTDKNYKDFNKFQFAYVWVAAWWASCILILAQPFMVLWVGDRNTLPPELVVLFALYFYCFKMNDMTYIYREAAGIWRQGMFVPLAAAMLNLVVSVVLVGVVGLSGVLIGSIVSLLFVYTPFYTYFLFKYYFKDIRKWRRYLSCQLRYFSGAVFVALVSIFTVGLIPDGGLALFVVKFLLMMIVPNLVLFLIYRKTDAFGLFRDFVRGVLLRRG